MRVVFARAEVDQLRIPVVKAAREAKGLEAGVGVVGDVAKFIVIHPLDNLPGGCIDHEPRTAQMVGNNAIGHTTLYHIIWYIDPIGIYETADYAVAAI